jgi:hypothetical protein
VAERGEIVDGLAQPVTRVGDDAVGTRRLPVDQHHRHASAQVEHILRVQPR